VIRRAVALAGLLLGAPVAVAVGVGPGTVDVRDEAGGVVATLTGPDALQDAVGAVITGRAPETRPWSIVAGAGTYGDVAVATPNLVITADAGAAVVVSGIGLRDDTGGGCVHVTRGGVTLQGIQCIGPRRTGVVATLRNAEGGTVVRSVTVERPGVDGVSIIGGRAVTLEQVVVTAPARDGIRLTSVTTRDPHVITGGQVTGAGRDGLRLADDVRGLQVTGLVVTGAAGVGIASEDSGNSDVVLSGVTVTGGGGTGVLIGGGTLRASLTGSTVTGNAGAGVALGDASGARISGIPVDGSNAGGDLVFGTDIRTGGAYDDLRAPDGSFALVGEPSAVRISGVAPARSAISAGAPARLSRRGPAVLVAATARTSSRRAVVRFASGAAVYRKAGAWKRLPSSRRVRGGVQAVLTPAVLGTNATAYAPFG
jgi:hypothetical protein